MASSPSTSDVESLHRELEQARLEASRERAKASSYAEEIRELKLRNLRAQTEVEREEEFLTNKLMVKLEKVNSEKREMLMRVEQEEEFLTNALQKRLDRVLREKHELEVQIATMLNAKSGKSETAASSKDALEQERKKLIKEKVDLERALETEQEAILNKLTKQTSNLQTEKETLRAERETLRKQVENLLNEKIKLHAEKVNLENTLEQEEENIVNRLQTQMLELYQRNQILQRRLEHGGSQTPSVVSESELELSEDEGYGYPGSRGRRGGSSRGRVGGSGQLPGPGTGHHTPWHRDMYGVNMSRRKSQGSASVSSAGTGGGRGGVSVGLDRKESLTRPESGSAVLEHTRSGYGTAMSVGGSSAATTPRSSVQNTPLSTPRSARRAQEQNELTNSPKKNAR